MKGAINYLKSIRDVCREYSGDCKKCPLGNKPKLDDNLCPRLTHPNTWSNDRIVEMVKRGGNSV
ncbi:MAG: hypothetical protein J6Y78_17815 [Paludibacteraceae bacterium]|nr:hypothetical protein [Paludibacteraceae bacterium]